jgi:hypothetical protein
VLVLLKIKIGASKFALILKNETNIVNKLVLMLALEGTFSDNILIPDVRTLGDQQGN